MSLPVAHNDIVISASILESWERLVEALPNVQRHTFLDYQHIKTYLDKQSNVDSYLTSPFYYLFTGRNGLWSYSDNEHKIFFCWHPNFEGQVLVFAPANHGAWKQAYELLEMLPMPPEGLKLARVQDGQTIEKNLNTKQTMFDGSLTATLIEEDVLDWRFPVRLLSTEKVGLTIGNKFRNVRHGLIHASKYNLIASPLNLEGKLSELKQLVHTWVSQATTSKADHADLYETYNSLFTLALQTRNHVDGLVYISNDQIQGVSLWEVSGSDPSTANLFANFGNVEINGIAEHSIVSVCQALLPKGVKLLNMGGSETASLDFFKNKFRPAVSFEISSIKVEADSIVQIYSPHAAAQNR